MMNWWQNFHDMTTAELFLKREDPVVEKQLQHFLFEKLQLKAGNSLFDQCCGIGSVSLPLAKEGLSVIGVDIIEEYINCAQEKASHIKSHCYFNCADAFNFVPDKLCDAAINWYSSFGYAQTDEQNFKMIKCAYDALKPGGWFALDTLNFANVLKEFKSTLLRKNSEGEIIIVRECELDIINGRLEQDWYYLNHPRKKTKAGLSPIAIDSPGQKVKHSSVKIYLPHQLIEIFSAHGFENISLYGDINGSKLHVNSPRCICVGRKKEEKNDHQG